MLEIRSTVPLRMSKDSSSLCRILLRLLSIHRPFSVYNTHTYPHVSLLSVGVIEAHFRSFTSPPGSPCLWSAPAGRSPQPGCGRAPRPAASASGCTDHSGRPWRSERRPTESNVIIYFTQVLITSTYHRYSSDVYVLSVCFKVEMKTYTINLRGILKQITTHNFYVITIIQM